MELENKFYKREMVKTADGSTSIYLPEFDEHYHSRHGAVQESMHVFIKMGWDKFDGRKNISILEIGFGTGLNAWLVYRETMANPEAPVVSYTSLETFPVSLEMANQLEYAAAEQHEAFMKLHAASWNEPVKISDRFTLHKIKVELQLFNPQIERYDLVFFDAFAPRVQPELWTKEIFEKLFFVMNPGGILVTYCSKGEVRRNMIAAGFSVEKVPGPPGKREMLRALKH